MVAWAQTRSIRLDIIPEALGLRRLDRDRRKKCRDQQEEESRLSHTAKRMVSEHAIYT